MLGIGYGSFLKPTGLPFAATTNLSGDDFNE